MRTSHLSPLQCYLVQQMEQRWGMDATCKYLRKRNWSYVEIHAALFGKAARLHYIAEAS